jgi:hypothetical protein
MIIRVCDRLIECNARTLSFEAHKFRNSISSPPNNFNDLVNEKIHEIGAYISTPFYAINSSRGIGRSTSLCVKSKPSRVLEAIRERMKV